MHKIENFSYDPAAVLAMGKDEFVKSHSESLTNAERAGNIYDQIALKHSEKAEAPQETKPEKQVKTPKE